MFPKLMSSCNFRQATTLTYLCFATLAPANDHCSAIIARTLATMTPAGNKLSNGQMQSIY